MMYVYADTYMLSLANIKLVYTLNVYLHTQSICNLINNAWGIYAI